MMGGRGGETNRQTDLQQKTISSTHTHTHTHTRACTHACMHARTPLSNIHGCVFYVVCSWRNSLSEQHLLQNKQAGKQGFNSTDIQTCFLFSGPLRFPSEQHRMCRHLPKCTGPRLLPPYWDEPRSKILFLAFLFVQHCYCVTLQHHSTNCCGYGGNSHMFCSSVVVCGNDSSRGRSLQQLLLLLAQAVQVVVVVVISVCFWQQVQLVPGL